jgi:hypothetical protein
MTTPPLTLVAADPGPSSPWPPATFTVTPIVDGDHDITTHTVQVGLSDVAWRQLVGDIARAVFATRMHSPLYPLLLAAGQPTNDLDRVDALTKLVARLNDASRGTLHAFPPSWDITPEEAMALGCEMAEAADDPKGGR